MNSRQQDQHDFATEAWAATGRRSRTEGLSAAINAGRSVSRRKPGTRASLQTALKKRQQQNYKANLRDYQRPVDNSRYFPHQSAREMARRVRQGKAS